MLKCPTEEHNRREAQLVECLKEMERSFSSKLYQHYVARQNYKLAMVAAMIPPRATAYDPPQSSLPEATPHSSLCENKSEPHGALASAEVGINGNHCRPARCSPVSAGDHQIHHPASLLFCFPKDPKVRLVLLHQLMKNDPAGGKVCSCAACAKSTQATMGWGDAPRLVHPSPKPLAHQGAPPPAAMQLLSSPAIEGSPPRQQSVIKYCYATPRRPTSPPPSTPQSLNHITTPTIAQSTVSPTPEPASAATITTADLYYNPCNLPKQVESPTYRNNSTMEHDDDATAMLRDACRRLEQKSLENINISNATAMPNSVTEPEHSRTLGLIKPGFNQITTAKAGGCTYDYQCEECHKLFGHESNLSKHRRKLLHEKAKGRNECIFCHKVFRRRSNLKRHLQAMHVENVWSLQALWEAMFKK